MKMLARRGGAALCAVLYVVLLATPSPASVAREQMAEEDVRLNAYARARMAEAERALGDAAAAYREAAALDPGSIEVAQRGFRQAVLAGDKALALQSAHRLDTEGMLPRDGTVLLLIEALERRKWDDARSLIDRLENEENLAFLVPFMRSWVSIADKPYNPPVVPPEESYAMFAVRYLEEQLLLQRLVLGDGPEASEAYADMKKRGTVPGSEERWAMAARFEQLGQHDVAVELLRGGGVGDEQMVNAVARAGKLYRKNRFTPLYGLAMLMNRLTLDLAGQIEGTAPMSIARMASFADPGNGDIRLNVARAALAADFADVAYSEAGKVTASSPTWFEAQALRVRALIDQERDTDAVARARQLTEAPGGFSAWRLLGDILMQTGDYAGAADAYAKAKEMLGDREDVALLLQLGGALEQAGKWTEAKPLLERVVELAPDSAVALNHLGYAMADRGEDLPRAIAMLEKANRLRPREPAFIDSLGWAYYRAGDYDKALPLIQTAVTEDPGSAELNEHLGDILWAAGRHFEARYAWKAALVGLSGDDGSEAMRARIVGKIDGGSKSANP